MSISQHVVEVGFNYLTLWKNLQELGVKKNSNSCAKTLEEKI
jgi:hypothetical protein